MENAEELSGDLDLAEKKVHSIETQLALVREECEAFHLVKEYVMPLEALAVMYAVYKFARAADAEHMEPYGTALLAWSSLMITDVVYHGIRGLIRARSGFRDS